MCMYCSSVATPFAKFSEWSEILQRRREPGQKGEGRFSLLSGGWLRDIRAATVFVSYSGHFSVSEAMEAKKFFDQF
jgi:hypothetical protein